MNVEIKTTKKIKHNRPDIVAKMQEKKREWQLIDIAIPQDDMVNKESEKVNKYVDLASIIGTEHKV